MLSKEQIFELHQLKNQGYSVREIGLRLKMGRNTIKKYLASPDYNPTLRKITPSRLDPFKALIDGYLDEDISLKAPFILHKIKEKGYQGQITILRNYLLEKRGKLKQRVPYIRFESEPGEQMQVDWGEFGSISYGKTKRRLYGLVVIECYSRMLYLEFTHNQKMGTLLQALLNAFRFFGGTPRELVVDNMTTAVTERAGHWVRFNESFLEFLNPLKITPKACNVRSPREKGKVERAMRYIRTSLMPLQTFSNLRDAQNSALDWLNNTANKRIHQTTGEAPLSRFERNDLKEVPLNISEQPEKQSLLVHKDFSLRFDGNTYTTPPWSIGRTVMVMATQNRVSIFYKDKRLAIHDRCWERKKRIETPEHKEQVKKLNNKMWADRQITSFASLGEEFREYLEGLLETRIPIKKNIVRLLNLLNQYGLGSLSYAIYKALKHRAFGADYIENILYQEMTPIHNHQPVKLKEDSLNQIQLGEPSLAEFDALILKKRAENEKTTP